VTSQLFEKPGPMFDRAALGVRSAVNKPCDPRVGYCAGAHGARLKRYIEPQAAQTVIANGRAGCPQSQDFGVGAGVMA
jgi:hypothetical protein